MAKKLIKREISDAVDILLNDVTDFSTGDIQELKISMLENYHDHPFTLYTGKRLEDMIDSIKENGILNPIIVLKKENTKDEKQNQTEHYEILSGHNRVNAARLADLKTVPCIVKRKSFQGRSLYLCDRNQSDATILFRPATKRKSSCTQAQIR